MMRQPSNDRRKRGGPGLLGVHTRQIRVHPGQSAEAFFTLVDTLYKQQAALSARSPGRAQGGDA